MFQQMSVQTRHLFNELNTATDSAITCLPKTSKCLNCVTDLAVMVAPDDTNKTTYNDKIPTGMAGQHILEPVLRDRVN